MANPLKAIRQKSAPKGIHRQLQRIGFVLIPTGNFPSLGYTDIQSENFINEFWRSAAANRMGLRFALLFVQWLSPVAMLRIPQPFSTLDAGRQYLVLERLHSSRSYLLRSIYLIINTLIQMAYYSDERVLKDLRYTNFEPGTTIGSLRAAGIVRPWEDTSAAAHADKEK